MSQIDTIPSSIDAGTGEVFVLTIDMTNFLLSGESLVGSPSPTVSITGINPLGGAPTYGGSGVKYGAGFIYGGSLASMTGSASVSGNTVKFTFTGSRLRAKQSYTFAISASTNLSHRLECKFNVNMVV